MIFLHHILQNRRYILKNKNKTKKKTESYHLYHLYTQINDKEREQKKHNTI